MRDQVDPVLAGADPGRTLVVAKSLGTYAAALVAECGVPSIRTTPLLTEASVVAALERASAPFLLVGGTGDPWWRSGTAAALTPHVLELAGADHGLFVPGPLSRSAANLGALADSYERFIDEVARPT